MIVYQNTAEGFINDVLDNKIDDAISNACFYRLGRYMAQNERRSWANSMRFMESILRKAKTPDDCGILIEYMIPATSRRIDFIISGHNQDNEKNIIIVELKQWDEARSTAKDSIVITRFQHGEAERPHPSYQAYSYKLFLKDFNENIYKGYVKPHSCAYLHNYKEKNPEPLRENVYKEVIKDTPLFFKADTDKLANFVARHVGKGVGQEILYLIEKGRIRPSRKLVDHVCEMFKGNQAFILIDEQKIAYEKAMDIALNAKQKTVLIIKGGPGTGKSVISMNILAGLLSNEENVAFVAPNASFREVMVKTLARTNRLHRLKYLFKGSACFHDVEKNTYDVLVIDEAHRLKNDMAYQYRGVNQVEDVIKAANVSIFFIDDNQKIRPEDIGSVEEIKRVAMAARVHVEEIELVAQFRCSGAEGYINWIDDVLNIRQTANYDGWNAQEFEFKIFDNPNELFNQIKLKTKDGFRARMLAGYAWPWTSAKEGNADSQVNDVVVKEHNFAMPWNSRRVGTSWAIDPDGINQIGCIHTSQGLEFDYVGIIVGEDLRINLNDRQYYVDWKSYKDVNGKKGLRDDPETLSRLVRNIYRTLMTRAMKGCYVYFCDKEVEAHFKERLAFCKKDEEPLMLSDIISEQEEVALQIESIIDEDLKFKEYLPVYSLEAACGRFGEGQLVEQEGWMKVSGNGKLNRNMFVVRAVGRSMEPKINDGAYCVFRANVVGSRQNKIVLVKHASVEDPETGEQYTIKKYVSKKKVAENDEWEHEEIQLLPLNSEYDPIIITNPDDGEFMVVAEFVEVV